MTDRKNERKAAAFLACLIGQEQLSRQEALRRLAKTTLPRPSSDLLEEELRRWFALFQPVAHADRLRQKREAALILMQKLRDWHPFLIGPVLSGAALDDEPPIIRLTGNPKAFELFLLARGQRYQPVDQQYNDAAVTFLTAVDNTEILMQVSERAQYPRSTRPDPYQTPTEAQGKTDIAGLARLLRDAAPED